MKTVTDAGNGDGEPGHVRQEPAGDRGAEGQPEGHHRPGRPDQARTSRWRCAPSRCRAARRRRRRSTRPACKLTPVTLEQDVKAALSKVKLGEVDAALVYRTDAKAAAADVDGVEFPESAGRDQRLPDRRAARTPRTRPAAQAFVGVRAVGQGAGGAHRTPGSRRRDAPTRRQSQRAGAAAAAAARRRSGLAFLVLPLAGLLVRAPWTTLPQRLTEPGRADRAAAVAADRDPGHRAVPAARRAAGLAAGPGRVPRPAAGPGAGHRAAGAAAGGRRRGAAAGLRPARAGRRAGSTRRSGSRCRSPPPASWSPRRSSRCRSWSSRSRARCAAPTPATRRPPPRSAPAGGPRSAASPCRWSRPGIAAGAVLCWARALGEFGATITFAGNFPGRTQTMPLAVYLALETDLRGRDRAQPDPARRLGRRSWPACATAGSPAVTGLLDAHLVVDRGRVPARHRRCAIARRRGGRAARPERRRQDHRAARAGRAACR